MQKSPNLYKVVVPGRFTRWFCDMSMIVTMEGKLRTNPAAAGAINGGSVNSGSVINTNTAVKTGGSYSTSFGAITSSTLFPDVYKVELDIQDLTPNHFNQYIDHLINGENRPESGAIVQRSVTNPFDLLPTGDKTLTEITREATSNLLK